MKALLIPSLLFLLIRAHPATWAVAVVYILWMALSESERAYHARIVAMGVLIPLCGVFPDLVAGLVFANLLALDGRPARERRIGWALPVIILTFVWTASRVAFEWSAVPVESVFAGTDGPTAPSGIMNVLRWFRGGAPSWSVAVEDLIRVLLMVQLWAILAGEAGKRFFTGLIIGSAITALAIMTERCAPELFSSIREPSPYWTLLKQARGLSTDPNAVGALFGSLIILAATTYRKHAIPLVVLLFIGGVFCGSRSFFLIQGLALVILLWRAKGPRFACISSAALGLVVAGVLVGSTYIPNAPQGIVRLRESLTPSTIVHSLETRTVFTQLEWQLFKDHPFLGVGLGRFDDYVVPYAHDMNLGTGLWRDIATNIYLEIFSELGLLGVFIYLITAASVRGSSSGSVAYKSVGLAYLLILFVIPHTVFPEGVALAALLLAQTVEPRKWRAAYGAIASGVLCIAVPLTYRHTAVYGFYPWEQTADGYTRWTATKSRGVFSCATTVELRLRNETPQTQRVEVSTITGTNHATLKNGEALFVALSCHDGTAYYDLTVSPGFTPFKYGIGNDNRLLGIRQESPKPIL